MTITIEIATENAAFEDDRMGEVKRIIQEWLDREMDGARLKDSNGNRVGHVNIEDDDEA